LRAGAIAPKIASVVEASRAVIRVSAGRWAAAWVALSLLLLVPLPAASTETSTVAAATSAEDPFPEPAAIRANVAFWCRVWSEWGRNRVVIHDKERLHLVWEVAQLPGEVGESLTREQREAVRALRESWQERLQALEQRLGAGTELTPEEQELVARVTAGGEIADLKGAHERVRSQRGQRERFRRGLELSARYDTIVRRVLREEGVPEDLAYLPHVESSYDIGARSSAGAVGMWQLTRPAARRHLRINATLDERLDPLAATRAAARYLRDAYQRLGSWPLAVTSYNHGVPGVERAVRELGADYELIFSSYRGHRFGFSSRNFYPELLAVRQVAASMAQASSEGLQPLPALDLATTDKGMSPVRLAHVYGLTPGELTELNPAWSRRAVQRGETLPAGASVWLPAGTLQRLAEAGTTTAAPSPAQAASYHVRPGDTLSRIAREHGLSVAELQSLNGLRPHQTTIRVGQELVVAVVPRQPPSAEIGPPSPAPVAPATVVSQAITVPPDGRHVVRRGETLTRIARRYGVQLSALMSANGLTARAIIHPGQVLQIPGPAG
jgi:membrane-bound lytic murein transglycosylase D